MSYRFEITEDVAGEYRARFLFNAEVMFSTEGYSRRIDAEKAIRSIRTNAPKARVVNHDGEEITQDVLTRKDRALAILETVMDDETAEAPARADAAKAILESENAPVPSSAPAARQPARASASNGRR